MISGAGSSSDVNVGPEESSKDIESNIIWCKVMTGGAIPTGYTEPSVGLA